MKILLTSWYREWRGSEPQVLRPDTFSLDERNTLFALVGSIGNGEFDEACIETDSGEAKECIEGMLCGTGGARRVEPSTDAEQCRLYRDGYEIYRQGENSYFFVNPVPRPELFETRDLNGYFAEFKPL